ncbi:Protein MON2-like protein [Diplonema papillatum]|nr:Protein MON2-like protein [Diplonema papillatum]
MTVPKRADEVVSLLQTLLVPDLKLVAQEAKKKHPPLKDACDRAVSKLSLLEANATRMKTSEVLRNAEEAWRPFLIACDYKGLRLTSLSVGALQRLLSHRLILQSSVAPVVSSLSKLKDVDESVQLKTLQCLMALFSSDSGYELTAAQMPSVISLAFAMYQRKNQSVQSTAAATLNQITTSLFDRLAQSDSSLDSPLSPMTPTGAPLIKGKSAYLLFKDLCTLASGDAGQFIKIDGEEGDVPKAFIFDLLHIIVSDYSAALSAYPPYVTLVREDLSLLLAQTMQGVQDLPCLVRVHRIVTTILQKFQSDLQQQQELFLNVMARIVEQPDAALWHKLVVLSCWRELAENHAYLKRLYSRTDQAPKQAKLFEHFVAAVCGVISKAPPSLLASVSMTAERTSQHKLLALKSEDEIVVKPIELVAWAVDIILGVCKSLSKLVEVEGRPLTDGEVDNNVEEQVGDNVSVHMLRAAWSPVLTACSCLLERANDEETIEETLRCFKQVTHACGKAGLHVPRDTYINALNRFTLPTQGGLLTPKNVQCLRVLFDVANGLGGALDGSWDILLTNFQQLNHTLESSGNDQNQSDVALIRTLLAKLFEGTKYFEDEALLTMMHALCKLSTEAVAASQAPSSPSQARMACSPFALQRLGDVAVTNVLRLHFFWRIISDHLSWLIREAESETLRKAGVKTASQVMLAYLQNYRQAQTLSPAVSPVTDNLTGGAAPPGFTPSGGTRSRASSIISLQQPQPAWLKEPVSEAFLQMQPKVIDLLRVMKNCERADVRIGCLNLIFTVLERFGQELVPATWRLILTILGSSSQGASDLLVGFNCVDFVCRDFMPILDHDGLQSLIACVGQFAQQTAQPDRTNTNLSAIQQWALSIVDYCASHPDDVLPSHLNSIFAQLRDAAADPRPVVRHSAMKTLFTAIATHGNTMPAACWNTLMWDVLLKLLDNVHSAALAAEQQDDQQVRAHKGFIMHHSRNTTAKQWYETRCTVLDGVARLFRMFYATAAKHVTRFTEVLTRLSVHLANSCLHPTDEVATVGLRSLQALLVEISNAPPVAGDDAGPNERPKVLWDIAWNTWERVANAAVSKPPQVTIDVVSSMAESIADIYQTTHNNTRDYTRLRAGVMEHSHRVLPLVEKLMKSSLSFDSMTHPSKLQLCILRCLQSQLIPPENEDLQLQLIRLLCSFLPSDALIKACLAAKPKEIPALLSHGEPQLAERVLQVIQVCFCIDTFPDSVRKKCLAEIVQAFRPVLMTRHFSLPKYEMWHGAIAIMPIIFQQALPTFSAGEPETEKVWTVTFELLQSYFFFEKEGVCFWTYITEKRRGGITGMTCTLTHHCPSCTL